MKMSVDITMIPDDYDGLKVEYITVRKELDIVKQDLYGAKRQIHTLEALQVDYQNDVELLQEKEKTEKDLLEKRIGFLEESNKASKAQYMEQIQYLETNKLKLEEENEGLTAEIDLLKKSKVSVGYYESTNKLIDELTNVKEENIILQTDLEELKISMESLQKININLEETVLEYQREINDLKESITCKREELLEANNLIQKLNEEIICLKTELETYKNQPLDKLSKGNSLFAEVDDRRVYLQRTINNMKSDFLTMKQERAKYLNEIHHLKLENKRLLQQWKTDSEEKEDDQYTLLKSYKDKIRVLEDLVEKYKKDLEEKPAMFSTGSFEELELYNVMLETKKKEIEDLRLQLASRTSTETLLSTALREANEKKRKYKLEASLKQKELEILQDTMRKEKELFEKQEILEERKEISLDSEIKRTSYRDNDVAPNRSIFRMESGNKKKDYKISVRLNESKKVGINDSIKKENISPTPIKIENEIENRNALQELEENSSVKVGKNSLIKVEKDIKTVITEKENRSDLPNAKSEEELGKKVTFSENAVSPKRTNSRRCTKVMVCKPMHFSNFSKPK